MNHQEALNELKSGRVRPVYLLYGGEPFLEEELSGAIRDTVVEPQTVDFNYHIFHPAAEQLQQALAIAQTQPFFAQRRLVLVKEPALFSASRKKQEAEAEEEEAPAAADEQLLAYLKAPVLSTCLVFLVSGSVDSRKKTTKALIASGGAVECKPLKEQDAAMWAQRRAGLYGKKLNDQAARILVEKVGPNLRLIDSELNKLSTYAGQAAAITPAHVEAAVSGIAETEIYHLTDAVMHKDRRRALDLLARTLRQVDHPLQVMAALTNRFRQILTVKALVTRGVSLREGPAMARIHPFPYEKMLPHVKACSRAEIRRALERLLEADQAIKSGADPKLAVETVVVELMQ